MAAVSAVSDHLEGKNDIDWSIVVIRGQSLSSLSTQSKPMDGCAAVADVSSFVGNAHHLPLQAHIQVNMYLWPRADTGIMGPT